jgi:hypothetical protein
MSSAAAFLEKRAFIVVRGVKGWDQRRVRGEEGESPA